MLTRNKTKQSNQVTQPELSQTKKNDLSQKSSTQTNNGRTNESLTEKLEELYTNIRAVPSYSAKIKEFLRTYELHSKNKRITRKKFPRRRVISHFPFDVFMADLFMFPQFKYYNNRFVYVLLIIDCFTKKVYAAPMKTKTKEETAFTFEKIFSSLRDFPIHLVTDNGKGELNLIHSLLILRVF